MKKYILSVMLVLLFVSVGFCNTDLSKLAGKQIYRDVSVNSKLFFSKEYMNIKYELYSYSDTLVELKQKEGIEYGKMIILSRPLWDDGNWKEWREAKRLTAEAEKDRSATRGYIWVGTTTAHDNIANFARKNDLSKLACVNCKKVGGLYIDGVVLGCTKCNIPSLISEYQSQTQFYEGQEVWSTVYGRGVVKQPIISFGYKEYIIPVDFGGNIGVWNYTTDGRDQTSQPQTLFPITTKQVIYNLDKLFPEKKVKQERLLVRELVGTETAGLKLSDWTSSYHCVVCGESLTTVLDNSYAIWFCFKCKKYFNIEKRD